MADVSYAEALQAELNETPNKGVDSTPSYLDSEGNVLTEDQRVHLSDSAEFGWDDETEKSNPRKFDFGRVDSLNADGTVNIAWDSAMCGCSGQERSRVENAEDVVSTTDNAVSLYYKGSQDGYDEGREELQEELRELLGSEIQK